MPEKTKGNTNPTDWFLTGEEGLGQELASEVGLLRVEIERHSPKEQELAGALGVRILHLLLEVSSERLWRFYRDLKEGFPETSDTVPEDPEEMSDGLLRRLETENALRILAHYKEIEERSIPGEKLREDLGFSREHMRRLRGQRRLLGIRLPFHRSYHYPSWQFDPANGESVEGLPELIWVAREEVGLDTLGLDAFMNSTRSGGGEPPYRTFREGVEGRRRVLELLRASHDVGS